MIKTYTDPCPAEPHSIHNSKKREKVRFTFITVPLISMIKRVFI